MKKNYYLGILLILTSCSFAPIRKQETEAIKREVSSSFDKYKVVFFDGASLAGESVKMREFDLKSELTDLKSAVERFINHYEVEAKSIKNSESNLQKKPQFVEGQDLHKPFNSFEPDDKGLYFGARKILALISDIDATSEGKDVKVFQIAQLAQAIFQKYTSPAKDEFEILALPITLLKYMNYPTVQNNNEVFTHRTDPEIQKEFISAVDSSEVANLYSYRQVAFDSENCSYLKAKRGYGVHSGFQIKCGSQNFKVKFGGEIFSGPFNSRIYSSLGYKVPTINYVEALRVKYDRKVIQEYNQRAALRIKLTLANQNVYQFGEKIMRDPFLDISKFILKDNTEMSSAEAKVRLMKSYNKDVNPEDSDFNFEFESKIDSIVLTPVTLTLKENSDSAVVVGPWKADNLNYSQFMEVRALMVLSAWVGNFDVRKDNLALYLENPKSKNASIRVGFGDVGSGLGKATFGLSKITSSEINNMVWQVSETYKNSSGEAGERDRIQLIGLMNIEANKAFQNINLSDAQWMLQKLCRISKENIREALMASGMSSAEVVLATEKLIYRRNKMLTDFESSKQLFSQCHVPANRKINYDPATNGPVEVKSSTGELVTAPLRGYKVRNGVLISD